MSMPTTTTRERPILFSGPMVRAVLEERKVQTRRVMKPQPHVGRYGDGRVIGPHPGQLGSGDYHVWTPDRGPQKGSGIPLTESCMYRLEPECPFGQPGDRLWVREAFVVGHPWEGGEPLTDEEGKILPEKVWYRATDHDLVWFDGDGFTLENVPWKSSLHMPRWASRLTLEVKEVRVERLQNISEADILAEGITVDRVAQWTGVPWSDMPTLDDAWREFWNHLNGKRHPWESNPFVWVIAFRPLATSPPDR